MRKSVLLAILCLAGCSQTIDSQPGSPTGNSSDINRFEILTVTYAWRSQVASQSNDLVSQRLKYPKTAAFDGDPEFAAYFDKNKHTSTLQISGHAHSFSPNGAADHQTYVVNWRQDGNAAKNKNTDWEFQSLDILDDIPR